MAELTNGVLRGLIMVAAADGLSADKLALQLFAKGYRKQDNSATNDEHLAYLKGKIVSHNQQLKQTEKLLKSVGKDLTDIQKTIRLCTLSTANGGKRGRAKMTPEQKAENQLKKLREMNDTAASVVETAAKAKVEAEKQLANGSVENTASVDADKMAIAS